MLGSHLIKSWATTQTVVALSSGEAEYYGITEGACESIGLRGIATDMNLKMKIKVHTDSSAAKGIATSRGLGKVKHLDTRALWVQQKVEDGTIHVRKVCGETNIAYILTKYLSVVRMHSLLALLPVQLKDGRHSLAPKLQDPEGGPR